MQRYERACIKSESHKRTMQRLHRLSLVLFLLLFPNTYFSLLLGTAYAYGAQFGPGWTLV